MSAVVLNRPRYLSAQAVWLVCFLETKSHNSSIQVDSIRITHANFGPVQL